MAKRKYIHGDNYVECDRCGFTYRRSQIVIEWTGLAVCKKYCFEHRHPQDKLRARRENTKAPDPIRPAKDQPDQVGYVDAGYWVFGYTDNDLFTVEDVKDGVL